MKQNFKVASYHSNKTMIIIFTVTVQQYWRVCEHDASLCDIFNGELGFPSLPCYSADGSG